MTGDRSAAYNANATGVNVLQEGTYREPHST